MSVRFAAMNELGPGAVVGGWRVERVLGAGAMGQVYLSLGPQGERAALKVVPGELAGDQRFRRRFQRETRLAAALSHPHVVEVLDSGEAEGRLYLAMRYVDGPDLHVAIAQRGRLHPADAGLIVWQVGSALDAAAGAGLVHRDVKPANVFVGDEGGRPHAYLGDFGLSKGTASVSGLTRTGFFVGTIDYAAPEQVQGEPVDTRADVYGLGVLLFEALTGEVPFPRERDVDKISAHVSEPVPRPSLLVTLPGAFDAVVARAMAKAPAERYATAGELGRAALAAAEAAGPAPPWHEGRAAGPRADPDAPTVA